MKGIVESLTFDNTLFGFGRAVYFERLNEKGRYGLVAENTGIRLTVKSFRGLTSDTDYIHIDKVLNGKVYIEPLEAKEKDPHGNADHN